MIRAAHSSDETRFPFEKRQSVPATARRLVRGSPLVAESCDLRPDSEACSLSPVVCPDGEPQAEPSENATVQVVSKRSRSAHAAKCNSKAEYHSLPPRVASRLAGKEVSAPPYPLCDLGLHPDEAKKVREPYGTEARRGEKFKTGRAPFDCPGRVARHVAPCSVVERHVRVVWRAMFEYCAVWRVMFESFASVERSLSPAFRLLLRSRGAWLRGEAVPDFQAANKLALDSVSLTIDWGAPPAELERVLHAYVEDIPTHVVGTITSREELVGEEGQRHPYGVIAGMVYAMVTRASYGSRLERFQSLDWSRVSCMLRGLLPSVQKDKKGPMGSRRGFQKIVRPEAFEEQYARLPVQPDDKSREWGVNSFAALPMFGGAFREDVAQLCGFRMPVSPKRQKRTFSGLWLTVVDRDATVAAPGFAPHVEEEAVGVEASTAHSNAVILGNLFAKWFGNCTRSGKETQVLVDNALGRADRYALEAGFLRCASRLGVPNSRASWFARDVPSGAGNAEWYLYEAGGAT